MSESKILITGGAGSIGSELVRQLAPKNKIFILDINETGAFDLTEELQLKGYWVNCRIGDVRDMNTVWDIFSDFKPDKVIHAAALKHVKPNETYPIEAIQTNVIGTYNVLHQSKNFGVKQFIFISTDKVVNANSVMGQTKKLGETMTINAGYTAVRFGNVIGSRGSVLPFWEQQAKSGGPITVTDKRMMRYFMSIPDACALVIEAMNRGWKKKIIILDMGELKNIWELAKELYPDIKKKIIGIRPGETLDEKLMTEEEKLKATKIDSFYVISS